MPSYRSPQVTGSSRLLEPHKQRTYFVLLDLPAGPPRAAIVHLHRVLLDEIERRDPDGFARWLDTGARAGSDPRRDLARDR